MDLRQHASMTHLMEEPKNDISWCLPEIGGKRLESSLSLAVHAERPCGDGGTTTQRHNVAGATLPSETHLVVAKAVERVSNHGPSLLDPMLHVLLHGCPHIFWHDIFRVKELLDSHRILGIL